MSAAPRRRSLAARRRRHGYLFVAPVFLFLCAIVVFPLGNAFWTSLHRVRGLNATFVGLGNYAKIFSDETFWHSLGVSFVFTGDVTRDVERTLALSFNRAPIRIDQCKEETEAQWK